ncbi:MAG: hypothetical protein HRT69_10940 [Flavobacteriaceae bacterium]|nr:hypothetical protein [Flavobacteriaceae bacterium]
MKRILLIATLICSSLFANAQKKDSIPVTSIVKIEVANRVQIDESFAIELVEVLSDSRCPKNVQCIRAGEAIILVNIYKNGEIERQEKLTIYPTSIQKNVLLILSSKLTKTTAISLYPYPNGVNKIELSNYCLELTVLQ